MLSVLFCFPKSVLMEMSFVRMAKNPIQLKVVLNRCVRHSFKNAAYNSFPENYSKAFVHGMGLTQVVLAPNVWALNCQDQRKGDAIFFSKIKDFKYSVKVSTQIVYGVLGVRFKNGISLSKSLNVIE